MFLAEFMLGTLAFVFREHLARSLKEELLYGIEKHYNVTREPGTLSAMWDHIHTEVRLIKIFANYTIIYYRLPVLLIILFQRNVFQKKKNFATY